MQSIFRIFLILTTLITFTLSSDSQSVIKGTVLDAGNNEPLIGATVIVKGTTNGTTSDWDGTFELEVSEALPVELEFSYIGYASKNLIVDSDKKISISLEEDAVIIEGVEVKGQRISEKQKSAPLTVESMDVLAIKETAANDFYDGLGNLKGVDLTAASLGFKVINTRGFNSTSPVRSLQIIDGVDNQSPGLNFSLGNFLGSSELDIKKVDIIQGAASAFYGPNAFNGVISMETKDPFFTKGLSASVKGGERNLLKTAIRYADVINNGEKLPFIGYKINLEYLRADDWVADNDNAVDNTDTPFGNIGGWDKVNTYGDEFSGLGDFSNPINIGLKTAGLGVFHREGYRELDLVDYDTRNLKANLSFHIRTQPKKDFESPELILSSSYGTGTTVYQGDNRFSLRNIKFFQNRLEFKKGDKYFIRAYATNEDAGDSYDPYFTALELQNLAKQNELWYQDYFGYWQNTIYPQMTSAENGFPKPEVVIEPDTVFVIFDEDFANQWLLDNEDLLSQWHQETAEFANQPNLVNTETQEFFRPGTDRFQNAFDSITALKNNEGGTRFFDRSALYHIHGEYNFETPFIENIKVGSNYRLYRPNSQGTVFRDTGDVRITNSEVGLYVGLQKDFTRKFKLTGTFRFDKNQNFDLLFTPALSLVYSPNVYNYLRASFSSGVRNPTLSDQYLNLDVGRATLLGNLEGYTNLITLESFLDYISNSYTTPIERIDVDPIQPEKVKTFELGYRTTLAEKIYIDASYYFNIYNQFIGYYLAVDSDIDSLTGIPSNTEVFRIASNSQNQVTTQGFSIGANYYFYKYYQISGNYSLNRLNKKIEDDPIIPAFNTPEHKYNIGISGRGIPITWGNFPLKKFGFNINYKWVQGFLFEGSPQFTGFIEDYGLLDFQINSQIPKINTTIKIGASNILNNAVSQTYGGPRIGRLAYISLLYEFDKK